MRSLHTNQSVPAKELLTRGTLEFVSNSEQGQVLRHERPGNQAAGVGPVGSLWVTESADAEALRASIGS